MSAILSELKTERFSENRSRIAVTEASAYSIPLIAVLYLSVIGIHHSRAGTYHALYTAFFAVVVSAMLLVVVEASRIRVLYTPGTSQLVVYNMFRSYRIPTASIRLISVGNYYALAKVAISIRVVYLSYVTDSSASIIKVPVLASFSSGKDSKLLQLMLKLAKDNSISCDIESMIY
jgi:hypothetical protein